VAVRVVRSADRFIAVRGITTGAPMSKRGRKKKDRKKTKANHGKRPNC